MLNIIKLLNRSCSFFEYTLIFMLFTCFPKISTICWVVFLNSASKSNAYAKCVAVHEGRQDWGKRWGLKNCVKYLLFSCFRICRKTTTLWNANFGICTTSESTNWRSIMKHANTQSKKWRRGDRKNVSIIKVLLQHCFRLIIRRCCKDVLSNVSLVVDIYTGLRLESSFLC